MSEDAFSRESGGDLGCIPKDLFGKDFAAAVSALKPREYTTPVESPWGFHLILRGAMTDKDMLNVLKNEYLDRATAEAQKAAQSQARVERMPEPDKP